MRLCALAAVENTRVESTWVHASEQVQDSRMCEPQAVHAPAAMMASSYVMPAAMPAALR
jgi:hypothetical protein